MTFVRIVCFFQVKGSLSTKVEAVVRTLLRVRRDDPKAKSLVFSTWTDVLDIIESALIVRHQQKKPSAESSFSEGVAFFQENNINYASLHTGGQGGGKFKRNLQKFKVRSAINRLVFV